MELSKLTFKDSSITNFGTGGTNQESFIISKAPNLEVVLTSFNVDCNNLYGNNNVQTYYGIFTFEKAKSLTTSRARGNFCC